MTKIVIVGGGLAGLISSILLTRKGFDITLIEKKHYPFHRVCGEYISNEVLPFLKSQDLDVESLSPSHISKLSISSVSGKLLEANLDLGGFGLSRYCFDEFLYKKASSEGVNFILGEKVSDISFNNNEFEITLPKQQITADLVIGAYGKRSNLDLKFERDFFYRRSPYIGVKYHIRTDFPADRIQLDNFEGGYCGIVKVEGDRYCLCYLSENKHLKDYGDISGLEKNVLYKNPHIKNYFTNSDFLFDKPEVINEISFENKSLVQDHVLFCGDAAGMITPLCGNGMAIAIHSAKILAEAISEYPDIRNPDQRLKLEQVYSQRWKNQFSFRLKTGRMIQQLFRSKALTDLAMSGLQISRRFTHFLISNTHGRPF
ncbi:MAG TPA: FAD-dependent oxidoreductase [Sphingobacteriaceae bacterium]|nr:FAD-dependent oxidoreductase [Sphingobacteriaceae bacterium]